MNCKNCNAELQEDAAFCPKCGLRVNGTQRGDSNKENGFEKVKNLSAAKKLAAGVLALLLLFIVYVIISPDNETSTNKTVAADNKANSQTGPAASLPQPTSSAQGKTQTPSSAQAQTQTPAQAKTTPAAIQTPQAAAPRNGFYKVNYNNGDYYEGYYVNDKKQGKGALYLPNGMKISGDFLADKVTGQESVTYPNGDTYEGAMDASVRTGRGTYVYAKGGYYSGMWSGDKKSGQGIEELPNGDIYEGDYVNDVRQDTQGKYTYANGVIYQGSFVNGKMTGQAMKFYSDGIYKGAFVNGLREGYGRFEWESGSIYDGNWSNDKKNGQGTYYNANTSAKDFGTWKDDVLVTRG